METTFITIHDLTQEARILYSSDSIVDILGHTPDEVIDKSCWEFFHPDELPFAREIHNRGVNLDKAAVLAYCQIRNREGRWIGCECCFTIVYDVMVVCTSIYKRGTASQQRAAEAPVVRKLFSSSPQDPRYHMLSHLSSKFQADENKQSHEPRAALFLNRFTRTLTIMYATNGVSDILGISGEEMKGRSFYYCIQQNCLEDAVRCLENAKGNDSIAYLRFWYRDPRQDDPSGSSDPENEAYEDEEMTDALTSSGDEDEGGVEVQGQAHERSDMSTFRQVLESGQPEWSGERMDTGQSNSTQSSEPRMSTNSSVSNSASSRAERRRRRAEQSISPNTVTSASSVNTSDREPIELEAVVSCTSDGLVVCLRRARPAVPQPAQPRAQPVYANGLFAAPWAAQPIMPPAHRTPSPYTQRNNYSPYRFSSVATPSVIPGPMPVHQQAYPNLHQYQQPQYQPNYFQQPQRGTSALKHDIMNSIRDVGVFAWALAGINGSLEQYSRGKPKGSSQPPGGLMVWSPGFQNGESPHSYGASNSGYTKSDSVVHFSDSHNTSGNSHSSMGSNPHSGTWLPTPMARPSMYSNPSQVHPRPQAQTHINGFGDPGLGRTLRYPWATGSGYRQGGVGANGAA